MSTPPKDPKTCPECGRQVRSVAQQCKYCGHRFPFDRKLHRRKVRERKAKGAKPLSERPPRPVHPGAERLGYWIAAVLIGIAVYQFIQSNKPDPPRRDYFRERQAQRYYDCVDRSYEPNASLSYRQCRELYGDAVRPPR